MDGDVAHGLQWRENMGVGGAGMGKDLERYISASDCFATLSFTSYILVLAVSIASPLCQLLDSRALIFPRTILTQSLVMR